MNASELAKIMLEYEESQGYADALRKKIEDAVMELQSTQKVGNVTATYRKPRKTYNYEKAAEGVDGSVIVQFTEIPAPRVDWRKICAYAEIEEIPYTESEPSVSVKLN